MKVIYENTELRGRYQSKVVNTEDSKHHYIIKGWELAKITEDEEGEREYTLVKKK